MRPSGAPGAATTPDGPGEVSAMRTLADGAVVASMVQTESGAVWSLQDAESAAVRRHLVL